MNQSKRISRQGEIGWKGNPLVIVQEINIYLNCCIAMTNYTNTYACKNHIDIIKTSDTVLKKNTPLTLFERVVCERELETEQNCNILTPTLMAISVYFPFSWAAQPGTWGPSLSGCWFSLLHLFSNSSVLQLPDFLSSLNYIIVQLPPSSCGRHNFALIQPVHGQSYNILIFLDRMHLLFTQAHFLFWKPGRVVGQYTTQR